MQPFHIHVDDEALEDLKKRLEMTRFPDQIENTTWENGTDVAWLRDLVEYWLREFDWRKAEAELNRWLLGASYSLRYFDDDIDDDEDDDISDVDHNIDLFAEYVFSSGLYVDIGYQYLSENGGDEHSASLTIGFPLNFSWRPGRVGPSARDEKEELERIRRIKRN